MDVFLGIMEIHKWRLTTLRGEGGAFLNLLPTLGTGHRALDTGHRAPATLHTKDTGYTALGTQHRALGHGTTKFLSNFNLILFLLHEDPYSVPLIEEILD